MFSHNPRTWTLESASTSPSHTKRYDSGPDHIIFKKRLDQNLGAVWQLEIYLGQCLAEDYAFDNPRMKSCLMIKSKGAEWFAQLPLYAYTLAQVQSVFDYLDFDLENSELKTLNLCRELKIYEENFLAQLASSRHLKRQFDELFLLAKRADITSFNDEDYNNRLCTFKLAEACLQKRLDNEALKALEFVLEDPQSCYSLEVFAHIEHLFTKDKPVFKDFETRQKHLKEKARLRLTQALLTPDDPGLYLLAIKTLYLQAQMPTSIEFRRDASLDDLISAILKISNTSALRKTPIMLPSAFNSPMMTPRLRLGFSHSSQAFFGGASSQNHSPAHRVEPKLLDEDPKPKVLSFDV